MPDLHAVQAGQHVARGIRQLARELAIGIPEELAALGVRRLASDAELLEGERVHDAAVAGGVHDVHLTIRRDLIELVPGRVAALGEIALLVSIAANGCPGGQLLGSLAHPGDDLRDRPRLLRGDVDPGEHLPVHERVRVGIDEARNDSCIGVVRTLRSEPRVGSRRLDVGRASHGEDAPAGAQERFSLRLFGVDGENALRGHDRGDRVAGVVGGELSHGAAP